MRHDFRTLNMDKIVVDMIRELATDPHILEIATPEGANESDMEVCNYLAERTSFILLKVSQMLDEDVEERMAKRTMYRRRIDVMLQALGITGVYGEQLVDAMYEGCF